MRDRHSPKARPIVFCIALIAALFWTKIAAAQTITEFTIPTAGSQPAGIAAGSDGALWFAEGNGSKIGRITTSGAVTEFSVPTANSWPSGITAGPDGALWFTERIEYRIGRITTSGAVTEYPVPTVASYPTSIITGLDGALWFVETYGNKIGRITTSGTISEFEIPTANSLPWGITAGPDGNLWFTEYSGNKIGRITTAGVVSEFTLPTSAGRGRSPQNIVSGPDGALWFVESDSQNFANIGRMTTSGMLTAEFPLPSPFSSPSGLTVGSDGALWFTEFIGDKLGRITILGAITEFPLPSSGSGLNGIAAGPDGAVWFTETTQSGKIGRISVPAVVSPLVSAVLPSSRSVQVGNTATAFATILNTGAAATGCGIAPVTPVPASFSFQTTNPTTNAITGTPNMPVSIAAGGAQTFVIAYTAKAPFVPTNVVLGFDCTNVPAVATIVGVSTLLLTFDSNPVPDVIVEGATATNDGIVNIPGTSGTGAFAAATVNIGSSSSITVSADTGSATLPLTATLCQTNPSNAQCLQTPAPSVTTTINTNATPTFSIFVTGTGNIPFDPANSRIFVRFKDSGGVTRGATSVAVRTQ